ncbi:MAG: hypothetical protein ACREN2_02215 [Candidatus Dormibacteria bacterium]
MASSSSFTLAGDGIRTARRDSLSRERADEAEQQRRIARLRDQAHQLADEIARRERAAGMQRGCCACCGQPPESDGADVAAASLRAS